MFEAYRANIAKGIEANIATRSGDEVIPLALSHCLGLPNWHHRFVLSDSLSDGEWNSWIGPQVYLGQIKMQVHVEPQ